MVIKPPFHAFTLKHNCLVDRIVTDISVGQAFDPTYPPDHPNFVKSNALWDTGATNSVLTESIVNKLGLKPVGRTNVSHAGGTSTRYKYIVNFILPNNVGIPGVIVTNCDDSNLFGAIIGMDIIQQGDFALTNVNKQTWLSFRIPSVHAVDYVVESNKIVFHNIGRNQPCPCGSIHETGRRMKFKECHGKDS